MNGVVKLGKAVLGFVGNAWMKHRGVILTISGFGLAAFGQVYETRDTTKETINTWIEEGKKRKEEEESK